MAQKSRNLALFRKGKICKWLILKEFEKEKVGTGIEVVGR